MRKSLDDKDLGVVALMDFDSQSNDLPNIWLAVCRSNCLKACSFTKKRLQYSCIHMSFLKSLRTTFRQDTTGKSLLNMMDWHFCIVTLKIDTIAQDKSKSMFQLMGCTKDHNISFEVLFHFDLLCCQRLNIFGNLTNQSETKSFTSFNAS